jgi:hypothetical protein
MKREEIGTIMPDKIVKRVINGILVKAGLESERIIWSSSGKLKV